jgi:hypothetical protein
MDQAHFSAKPLLKEMLSASGAAATRIWANGAAACRLDRSAHHDLLRDRNRGVSELR